MSAELERRQELLRVGSAPYMHTLIATVPTAANAGYYAEIVAEKAILRRPVRAKARRLKQRSDIQLIVVDYVQLMTAGKQVESRQQEVSEFSRSLKLLAKE